MRWLCAFFHLLLAAATVEASPEGDDLRRENQRLKDEIAALTAGDPAAARRKAVEDYLTGHQPAELERYDAAPPYYRGGFVLETADGQHRLRINLLNQFGWRWTRDVAEAGATQARFQYQALRIRLSGHGFSKRLEFFFDIEFGPNAERFPTDVDALAEGWIRYRRAPWRHLRLVAGRLRPRFTTAENVDDMALSFAARGLVTEYFTVGRTNGIGVVLENLRDQRSALQLTLSDGSERFDPDQPLVGDDKRAAISFQWARTLVGDGHPWEHTAYEGAPYRHPEGVLVLAIGFHIEDNNSPSTAQTRFWQAAVDVVWRRGKTYAAVHGFVRANQAGGTPGLAEDDEDYGLEVMVSHFVFPRRMEIGLRGGWIGYASHVDPGGDLIEVVGSWNYYWKHENNRLQGHRVRLTIDFGYAERVVLQSSWTGWRGGLVRGWLFRSQLTILF